MRATLNPIVKICCIGSIDEAKLALAHGASALGLVSPMPSGPGTITEEAIAEIVSALPRGVDTFLLTCQRAASAIIAQQRQTQVTTLQLVDSVEEGTYQALRGALPEVRIVQVIHILDDNSIAEAQAAAPHVDVILLDSGQPNLAVKELGGTGRVHNWEISRRIREGIERPVFLAGGLRPDNVGTTIREVGPYGLDLCSGVRTGGRLDPAKLRAFFDAVRATSSA